MNVINYLATAARSYSSGILPNLANARDRCTDNNICKEKDHYDLNQEQQIVHFVSKDLSLIFKYSDVKKREEPECEGK